MTNQIPYRLGLDLGTNSIGWAMLALNENNEPDKILDAGVRIFSDGRVPKTGEPLAVTRRIARGARRRRDRYLSRRKALMNYLIQIGLMPENELERKKLELLNPYQLRSEALERQLLPQELARAIFHLNQRRGFKSNRKEILDPKEISNEDEEKNKPKKENAKIKDDEKRTNQKAIEANNCRTLGEYLFKFRLEYLDKKEPQKNQNQGLTTRAKPDENALYPTRKMYEDEFLEIQKFQQKFQEINEENWQKIKDIIFYQRKLKPQDKGSCRFLNIFKQSKLPQDWVNILNQRDIEKFSKGLHRAYLALPSYQKFRILSEVNNLKLIDKKTGEDVLILSDRQKIITKLIEQKSPATFKSLRKLIEAKIKSYPESDYQFNLESERRKGLDGNATKILLEDDKYFGEKWNEFSLEKQDEIVEFLFEEEDEKKIIAKALNDWNLSQIGAENLSKLTINEFGKTAVGAMCKEILQRLCAKMIEKNCRYDEALKELGINHSDEEYADGKSEELSYYAEAIPASVVKVKSGSKEEEEYGKIANPTVHIALNQIRKVVNSLIEEYGKPAEIHIELARDLKQSKDEKKQAEKRQSDNQKENENAAKELETQGIKNNYDNRLKFKLFKELEKANSIASCPFSGKTISITNLFSHEVEIEHILPFSQTFDDSFANKTIAYKQANNVKGNRSPFEAFGNSPSGFNYAEILNLTKNLPKNKSWRFGTEAMERFADQSGFIASQLNDTRYLSKIAKQYLSQICESNKIRVANGKLTYILRRHWGLNSILEKQEKAKEESQNQSPQTTNYDPITGEVFGNEENNLNEEGKKPAKKNRDDHRHHAIDAFCVAMTDTALLNKISRANSKQYDLEEMIIPPPNGQNRLREDVKDAIDKIVVSYKTDHSTNSELHSQTYYGILKEKIFEENSTKDPFNIITSKSIARLKKTEIKKIRDKKIRVEVEDLTKHLSKDKKDEKALAQVMQDYSKQNGIKNIRILDKTKTIIKISHPAKKPIFEKAISPDGNNHISIWKMPNGELITDVVSNFRMNSIYEIKGGEDGILFVNKEKKFSDKQKYEKLKPHPAAKLIIRLFKDDLIRLEEKGELKTARIGVIGSNTQCKYFDHKIPKDEGTFYLNEKTLKTKKLRKIFITPTGKIFDSGAILK